MKNKKQELLEERGGKKSGRGELRGPRWNNAKKHIVKYNIREWVRFF